jgi:two-component system, chemotaxis family, sensor kinase CheA
VFHAARLERLQFLASHAAVAIENAKLYGQVQAARRGLEEANSNLEQKVRARTAALSRRNADLRRVLDTVTQGLITLDLQGRISVERSAAADRWFGPFGTEDAFADHMRRFDARFGDWFEVSFQTLLDGFLTPELAIAQLPARLRHGGREYRCSYSAIRTGDGLSGVLVAISDETDALNFAREELAQKELLALCRRVGRDRSSVLGFFEEGREMLAQLHPQQSDADLVKRTLHTLKGNAGMLELSLLAERCHAAEDALAEGGDVAQALAAIHERWDALSDTLDQLLGRNHRENLEVPRAELQRLIEEVDAGCSTVELGEQLRRLQLEPLERPLLRLGRHAQGLSQRLGRGSVQIEVESGGVLGDPEQGRSFWLALVHIIRNAVDHGFEGAEARSSAGKRLENQLRLSASWQSERVVVRISDDGRGIDWPRVQQLAAQRGLPCNTRAELAAALLAPELTTRTEVTSTSGRGVGMAAVERDIRALDGSLAVESETGAGCTWIISVPAARLGAVADQPTSGRRSRHSHPPSASPKSAAAR